MKVTVTFGDTAVVVPCKPGWTVRDLIEQATRRYRKVLEQRGDYAVSTHHVEYYEGGILDMDDLLADLVEDRDKLVAVFEEIPRGRTESPGSSISNGRSSPAPSREAIQYFPHLSPQQPIRGEIEVNEAVLRANNPLLVRSSSDSALAPPVEMTATPSTSPDDHGNHPSETDVNHILKGALDRLQHNNDNPPAKMSQVNYSTLTKTVELSGDQEPLGIHVVPYCSSLSGRTLGLHIKGIEENSRSRRNNIFQEDECIVQINDTLLQDKTFAHSQELFRQAMASSVVRLQVLPVSNRQRYEKSLIGQLFTAEGHNPSPKAKSPMVVRTKADAKLESKPEPRADAKVEARRPDVRAKTPDPPASVNPPAELQSGPAATERVSPTPAGGAGPSSPTLARKSPAPPGLASLTSRKGGKRIKIDLKKGPEGLGFTVVTRDSSVHGPGPILVKNILQRGAAVKDGRLQPGDRILEVNGVDMTGRSQEELVAMLRSTKQGESVCVVVARQEDIFLPRELKGEDAGGLVMEDGREQLMYEIPLNDTGSAGLGVSLKGNKSRETGEDLGIFIKSIIHGGAAYKDGRLRVNDQLIAVNGASLLGRSNHAAMETLRRSMSSEGNARGTIQLVLLRAAAQMGYHSGPSSSISHQPNVQPGAGNQELQEPGGANGPSAYQGPHGPSGPLRPTAAELNMNGLSQTVMTNSYAYSNSANAAYPAATDGGSHGHYGDVFEEELEEDFPPPPSPGAVEEMNRDRPLTPPSHSEFHKAPHLASAFYTDNTPRNRTSKSMDLVADESNVASLVGQKPEPSSGGVLGPTLGLWKSSSLESLQTAVSEARQSQMQAQVPFHRPRPHMVRGRGCNQSFRLAIDKSYDGPSEDDDDLSEQSSGRDTPASGSSRQGLDTDDGKKKKKGKPKKKEKKGKGKKKTEDSSEDLEKKTKRKGFGLLRFGKKKEDKSKEAVKAAKNKLEALSEEELDKIPDNRAGSDPRYAEVHSGRPTPDPASLPDVEDDDSDPNYARINTFRPSPSPQLHLSRTPSPGAPVAAANPPQPSAEDLEGLYAKVNKHRAPPAAQNQTQADSDQRLQVLRREYQQARAAPAYEELDAARRRFLEYDPHRLAPRGADTPRPAHRYEEVDRQYPTHPRRDPYDYPTHSRPMPRDPSPYQPPTDAPAPGRQSQQQAPKDARYYPPSPRTGQQHRAPLRQDVPPSPTQTRRGRHHYDTAGRQGHGNRQASPGRYVSPERYEVVPGRYVSPERYRVGREHYTSPERYGYGERRQPDPRQKNPVIGAV
ncbi:par-3 family cell polarity regulator beta a [Myripristis murdjan]|uniref:par-3 family cell polarity regulator beta a n=1 Tax=Myripristis murdjan TaxID=586833 RepID=UPI0011761189|nr:partitioning defective 3 homolog B-like [Myripristis murdjan]XP_029928986.1 partitioning defective 3 homolog B-like [Myripristis murdjan]